MTARILTGSKEEIAQKLVNIDGEVTQAIVLIDEQVNKVTTGEQSDVRDIFAEMEPFTVRRGNVDDSRRSIYTRAENE